LLLSIIQHSQNLVVAGISWIRVMCWNRREPRPHPTYRDPGICCKFLCMYACQKYIEKRQYASISLTFISFVLNIPWTYHSYKSYVFFIFGTATFWRTNYITNLAPKN
jgi:hypothetical protein